MVEERFEDISLEGKIMESTSVGIKEAEGSATKQIWETVPPATAV